MRNSRISSLVVLLVMSVLIVGISYTLHRAGVERREATIALRRAQLDEQRESVETLQQPDTEAITGDERRGLKLPQETVAAFVTESESEKVKRLEARIKYLEMQLKVLDGPVKAWLATIRPAEEPDAPTLALMADLMAQYPITLLTEEGLWLAERVRSDDWLRWGPTIDEAMVAYFGSERLREELTPEQFANLTK